MSDQDTTEPIVESGIQYRSFTSELEVAKGGDGRIVRGIAVPYGQIQRINDRLTEEFVRGAFDHQLSAIHRVSFYRGHSNQGGILLGRQIEGRDDAAGFYGEWRVSKTVAGDETLELVKDEALTDLSIGFRAMVGGNEVRDGVTRRRKAHLFETAIVPEGAYGGGAVITGTRSVEDEDEITELRAALEREQAARRSETAARLRAEREYIALMARI